MVVVSHGYVVRGGGNDEDAEIFFSAYWKRVDFWKICIHMGLERREMGSIELDIYHPHGRDALAETMPSNVLDSTLIP